MKDANNNKPGASDEKPDDGTAVSADRQDPAVANPADPQTDHTKTTATKILETEAKEDGVTVGSVLDGRFEIVSVLGKGGMGTVFLGKHLQLERLVAIKVMLKSAGADKQQLRRFLNEGKALAQLRHPKITECYFIGVADEQPYMVMEHLRGKSLWQVLKESRPLDVPRAIDITLQIADALGFAHMKGIIHRDLKPGNVMLIEDELAPKSTEGATQTMAVYADSVKVLDFGIAKFLQESGGVVQKITQSGELIGTFKYMSPEQCNAKQVDQRSDIFSLGVMLYEMIAGTLPFIGEGPLDTLNKISNAEVPPIERQLPPGLYGVLLKSLAKSPDKRYQDMSEFSSDLQLVRNGQTKKLGPLLALEKAPRRNGIRNALYTLVCASLLAALSLTLFTVVQEKQRTKPQLPDSDLRQHQSIDEMARRKFFSLRDLGMEALKNKNYAVAAQNLTTAIDELRSIKKERLLPNDNHLLAELLYLRGNIYLEKYQSQSNKIAPDAIKIANDYAEAADIIAISKSRNKSDSAILLAEYICVDAMWHQFPGQFSVVETLLRSLRRISRASYGNNSTEVARAERRLSENLWEQSKRMSHELAMASMKKQSELNEDVFRIYKIHGVKDKDYFDTLIWLHDYYCRRDNFDAARKLVPDLLALEGTDKVIDAALMTWMEHQVASPASEENKTDKQFWINQLNKLKAKKASGA